MCHRAVAWASDITYVMCHRDKGIIMDRKGLHLLKRGHDGITYSFVAKKTNLFPSYSLTNAEGRTSLMN